MPCRNRLLPDLPFAGWLVHDDRRRAGDAAGRNASGSVRRSAFQCNQLLPLLAGADFGGRHGRFLGLWIHLRGRIYAEFRISPQGFRRCFHSCRARMERAFCAITRWRACSARWTRWGFRRKSFRAFAIRWTAIFISSAAEVHTGTMYLIMIAGIAALLGAYVQL